MCCVLASFCQIAGLDPSNLGAAAARESGSLGPPAPVLPQPSLGYLEHSAGELRLGKGAIRFDLSSEAAVRHLRQQVQAALQMEETADPSPPRQSWAKKARRGLKEMDRLAAGALGSAEGEARRSCLALLLETVAALNNGQRSPVPENMDLLTVPWTCAARLYSPVGRGAEPARNLRPGPSADLSRLDPLPSTLWRRPDAIEEKDLYRGFGRSELPRLEDCLCEYAGPKESYGLNPGFEMRCQGKTFKVKLREVSSEPFAARLFWALGYHVEPTDYARQLKVRYDRSLFREFHSRKAMKVRFTLLHFLPVFTVNLQQRFDPFDYIARAALWDGREWTGGELRTHLFQVPGRPHPEDDPANFRPEVESQIAYLVTAPANVQVREASGKSVGPWDFGQLGHADWRELRGAGLLAAWVGWFDTRFDNTRLRLVKQANEAQVAHYFTDLGGVLGGTGGWLFSRGEQPNAFPWTFTRPPLWQGPHRLARPLRLTGYRPTTLTPPFAAMTLDDARWMARLIGRLTEPQLVQALVASGYDSATVRLYTEKLVSRRDRMLSDLGLSGEFPPYRPGGAIRNFCHEPLRDGPVRIEVPGLGQIQASLGTHRVVRGRLAGVAAVPPRR